MGLRFIPETSSFYIFENAVDEWGIKKPSAESKREVKCFLKGSEALSSIESKSGKQIKPTYDLVVNGTIDVNVGDVVLVEGYKLEVLRKSPKKDLSGKVLITKLVV